MANLSKLLLSPEEKEAAAKDMEEIVEFANQLQAIDTENIPAAAHTAKADKCVPGGYPADVLSPGSSYWKTRLNSTTDVFLCLR